ncbi:MAG: class I SAM-dependent methyltransferase [Desulfomonilaceae bacterium]
MYSIDEISSRVRSFPRWHYEFDLKGIKTVTLEANWVNRHAQRRKYFFDPLVKWYGGSLHGKRILDLGCNAGFWSLNAVQAGCDFVLGIDGRKMHIEQANFVFDVHAVPAHKYLFLEDNVFNYHYEKYAPFDIVFCLGLFYHINRHIELLRSITSLSPEVLIIDTSLTAMRGSFLKLAKDDVNEPRMSIDHALVYYPTAEAVIDLVSEFGFSVVMLKPLFDDYDGALDYKNGSRRAFVCSSCKALENFPAPFETVDELPY